MTAWNSSSASARATAILAGLACLGPAAALDVDDLEIDKDGRTYTVSMTFGVAAPVDRVIAVLTDFESPELLGPDVTNRTAVDRGDGVVRVHTEVRSCLFLFCRNLAFTQDVTITADTVRADIVPETSDFRSGTMRWVVSDTGGGITRVAFESTMEPGVFIPPLIGSMLVRRMLEREVLATATNVEAAATRSSAP